MGDVAHLIAATDREGRFSGYYRCSLCDATFRPNPVDRCEMMNCPTLIPSGFYFRPVGTFHSSVGHGADARSTGPKHIQSLTREMGHALWDPRCRLPSCTGQRPKRVRSQREPAEPNGLLLPPSVRLRGITVDRPRLALQSRIESRI